MEPKGISPQIGLRLPSEVMEWLEGLAAPEQMSVAAYIKRSVERSYVRATGPTAAKEELRAKGRVLAERAEASGCGHPMVDMKPYGIGICKDCGAVKGVDSVWRAVP